MAQGRGHNSSSRGGKTMHSRGYFNNVTGAYRINGVEVAFDPELEYNVKKESEPLFPVRLPAAFSIASELCWMWSSNWCSNSSDRNINPLLPPL